MTDTRIAKSSVIGWVAALAVALMLACAFAVPAYAKVLEAPTTVADDITRLHVNKLDADTHEPVVGATLVIVDEQGKVIYTQLVEKIENEPDYASALAALK